mgnify:CR=1 FL=1
MPKQLELFTSEWGVRNDVAHLIDPLNELIPMFGMVKNANKNKALEKFRKAQGVAYDIFNNGLINKGKSLKVLGLKRYDLPLILEYISQETPGEKGSSKRQRVDIGGQSTLRRSLICSW